MSRIPKYAAKRDKTENEIVTALRQVGAYVKVLSAKSVWDLAVYYRGIWYMIDAKTKKGKLTEFQTWDADIEPGAVKIVRTAEEALRVIGAIDT